MAGRDTGNPVATAFARAGAAGSRSGAVGSGGGLRPRASRVPSSPQSVIGRAPEHGSRRARRAAPCRAPSPRDGRGAALSLPRLLVPELERLQAAVDDDDENELEATLEPAVARIDTWERRCELARALILLRDSGKVEPRIAAVAMSDLNAKRSRMLESSLVEAIAVSVGAARTPASLVVAAH
jgi:hypothetical protein